MTEVQTSKELPGSTSLWRYMSLDKFVDLLATGDLFFSPLAWFHNLQTLADFAVPRSESLDGMSVPL